MCDSREEPYLPLEGCRDLTSPRPCNFYIVYMKTPGHIELFCHIKTHLSTPSLNSMMFIAWTILNNTE